MTHHPAQYPTTMLVGVDVNAVIDQAFAYHMTVFNEAVAAWRHYSGFDAWCAITKAYAAPKRGEKGYYYTFVPPKRQQH